MHSEGQKYGRIAIVIVICTLVTKFFGAGRDLVLSYCYGSTNISDAYILASTLPVTIFAFIYEGIAASYIPASARLKDQKEQNKLTSNLIHFLLCLTGILVIVIEIFPEQVIKLFASGFSDETLGIAVYITRLSVLGVFFSSVTYVLVYYLNYHNSFLAATMRAIPMDLTVIVSIIAGARTGNLFPLAIGIPLSLLCALLFILPFALKKGYRYTFRFTIFDEGIKNIIIWSVPVIVASAITEINSIIDRQFASWLVTGGISSLTYASRTLDVIRATLFIPVVTVLFPEFSRDMQAGEKDRVIKTASQAFSVLAIIAVPLTFGAIILSKEIVSILFQRGAFDEQAVAVTGSCLKYYAVSLCGYAVITMTTKIFHAMTDMKSPMRISMAGVMVNIMGNFIFSKLLGISGLALATSLSLITIAVMQYLLLNRNLHFDNRHFIITVIKSLLASSGMLVTLCILKHCLENRLSDALAVIVYIAASILIYMILLALQKTEELKLITALLKKK